MCITLNLQHVQQKLREEIIGVLGDEPVDIVPTLEQLKEMPYLNLVIQEVNQLVFSLNIMQHLRNFIRTCVLTSLLII